MVLMVVEFGLTLKEIVSDEFSLLLVYVAYTFFFNNLKKLSQYLHWDPAYYKNNLGTNASKISKKVQNLKNLIGSNYNRLCSFTVST